MRVPVATARPPTPFLNTSFVAGPDAMRWTLSAAVILLLAVPGAAAQLGFPEPVTERAKTIEDVYNQIAIAGVIVFIIVFALLAWVLIRYRENGGKGRATYEKERDNIKAEMAWTIIPLIIVMWVGVISYQALVDLDDLDGEVEPYATITIQGFQWFWQADYGDDVTVSAFPGPRGNLSGVEPFVVPAGVPLQFDVIGMDVIHSFNIVGLAHTLVPGQVNSMIVAEGLPEGEYFTQCKEDCLTPGHSYMRAMVEAVPVDEYHDWLEAKRAGAAAGLVQHIPVVADGATLSTDKPLLLAQGATVRLQIANDGAEQTFQFAGTTLTIPAGATDVIEVPAETLGPLVLVGDAGGSIGFEVVAPQTRNIELGAFEILPGDIQLQAQTVYVFNVENTHGTAHNIFIGMDGADGKTEALWMSATLNSGGTDTFIVVPSEAATLDTWCAVPGHYAAGMHGSLTVV